MLRLPDWHDDLIRRMLGHAPGDESALRRIDTTLARLSDYFTDLRPRASGTRSYFSDPSVRNAYFLYYTTANLLKPLHVLDELMLGCDPRHDTPLSVLDLGCGTATGLLALTVWRDRALRSHGVVPPGFRYTGADRDGDALAFTRRTAGVLSELGAPLPASIDTVQGDLARGLRVEGRHDIVFAMNLLNEMPADRHAQLLEGCAGVLAPGGSVVLIEPALRETSRALLALRDQAVATGWTVYAPCFRQGECPALADARDWCHHDLPWERPVWMERLDRALGAVKLSLKFSYLVLNRHGATLADAYHEGNTYHRVVSEVFLEKGRTLLYLCGEEGRHLYQRNRRDVSYENAVLDDLARYDVVAVENAVPRTHDVLITQDSTVIKV